MVVEDFDSHFRKLELRVQKNEEVIVGLRGLVKALLVRSTWTDQDLKISSRRKPATPLGQSRKM